jgi:hypothetical protein
MYKRIPEEKRKTAKAMLRAGKRVFEVAQALELSRATVYRLRHEDADEDVEALAEEIRKSMAGNYLLLADTILKGINDRELDRASLRDKAIAAAIFTDKAAQLDRPPCDGKGKGRCPLELETGMRRGGEDAKARDKTESAFPKGWG